MQVKQDGGQTGWKKDEHQEMAIKSKEDICLKSPLDKATEEVNVLGENEVSVKARR